MAWKLPAGKLPWLTVGDGTGEADGSVEGDTSPALTEVPGAAVAAADDAADGLPLAGGPAHAPPRIATSRMGSTGASRRPRMVGMVRKSTRHRTGAVFG